MRTAISSLWYLCLLPTVLWGSVPWPLSKIHAADDNKPYTMDDFSSVPKIDAHAHIHTENSDFVSLARRDGFRFVNMAVWSSSPEKNVAKHRTMWLQFETEPDRCAPVCSFPLENWDDEDWSEQTIAYLKTQFDRGAVGVKIWKNIGMGLRDQSGRLVMVDDPKLDPVINYIESQGRVLLGHLGEPKNCWLPIDEMTTLNDRSYFQEHPEYHMFHQPEMPSYEEQIAARDRMLAKHPRLSFVGCHLASLEWNIERMAAFLDRFPLATIGVAARMGQIQHQSIQDPDRVRAFFVKYQDRILYGTDLGVGPGESVDEHKSVRGRWLRDWKYFNTREKFQVPELEGQVAGLALPRSIVDKIYRENALRVFASSWTGLSRTYQLEHFEWLAGDWKSESEHSVIEETWMVPRGNVMLGVNRTVRDDGKTSFEYMRLVDVDGDIGFLASPSGREPTAFRLMMFDEANQRAMFENAENDFPQRIYYDRSGDKLWARIEGDIDGQLQSLQWEWRKIEE